MKKIKSIINSKTYKNKYLQIAVLTILVLYPLRWTFSGLDLWDSGYNCLNYVCFGPEYMNPSLFYSTFLASAAGRLFYLLPFGDTYAGLRLYCGLVISANVLISSLFCIRKLKLNIWAVITGGLLAVSLCYSPTVVLYNHLSFLLLTVSIILLYNGLTGDRSIYVALAGFVLGLNIFVRFPNITQAALILAVWYYLAVSKADIKKYVRITLLCLGGWLVSFVLMYVLINGIYGAGSYISGIKGLFSISEGASDYSAVSMLTTMLGAYIRGFRRLADVAVFTAGACLVIFLMGRIQKAGKSGEGISKAEKYVAVSAGIGLIIFFVIRRLMQFDFHHYITVILTAAMFIDVVIILCLLIIAGRMTDKDEKLIAALIVMQTAVLSVGSNTGISPAMNDMFLAAPFMVHYFSRLMFSDGSDSPDLPWGDNSFLKKFKGKEMIGRTGISVLTIALIAFYVQCVLFGLGYVYEEAENGLKGRATVRDNRVLCGTRMSDERAGWMQELTDYINDEELVGHDVIVYGYAPSLVYYLSLKPVIGSWPDLDSYGVSSMEADIEEEKKRIDNGERECPIIIFDNENIREQQEHDPAKWDILDSFMDKYSYEESFYTGRFSVYRPGINN